MYKLLVSSVYKKCHYDRFIYFFFPFFSEVCNRSRADQNRRLLIFLQISTVYFESCTSAKFFIRFIRLSNELNRVSCDLIEDESESSF